MNEVNGINDLPRFHSGEHMAIKSIIDDLRGSLDFLNEKMDDASDKTIRFEIAKAIAEIRESIPA
ncbi:hypothetical protein GF325_05745 [Candidatus Bathyarchaeota archaeon]|nr:hypothetical protein [Candidatus Bathyarchaeota archaeon]